MHRGIFEDYQINNFSPSAEPWERNRPRPRRAVDALRRIVPLFGWLSQYNFTLFTQDLFAGVTLSMFLIPQGLAYSSLCHLPPVNGLYVCVYPAIVYAIFGTSRQISVGPEAVSSMLLGSFALRVADLNNISKSSHHLVKINFILLLLEGAILVMLGLLKLGLLDSVLIRAVVTGMIMAVGSVRSLALGQTHFNDNPNTPDYQRSSTNQIP